MGLFKRRKEENDGSAEVGSVDEWLLSLDADAKAGANSGQAASSKSAPMLQPSTETSSVDTMPPPPPQGQPTTGTALAHADTAKSAEDMWHLPDFDVDQKSYVSADAGIGGAGVYTDADQPASTSHAEPGGPSSEFAIPAPPGLELGLQTGSPMDFFDMEEPPDSAIGKTQPGRFADQANDLSALDALRPSAEVEPDLRAPAQQMTAQDNRTAPVFEAFGQPHPPNESYDPASFGDAAGPDVLNASLLHPPVSTSDSASAQTVDTGIDLSAYGALVDAPNEGSPSRWSPELASDSETTSFLNDLPGTTNRPDSGSAPSWQPLAQAPFADVAPLDSTGLFDTLGAPSPGLPPTVQGHLNTDPFQNPALEPAATLSGSGSPTEPLDEADEASGGTLDVPFGASETFIPIFDETSFTSTGLGHTELGDTDIGHEYIVNDRFESTSLSGVAFDTPTPPPEAAAPIENPWLGHEDLSSNNAPTAFADGYASPEQFEPAAPLFTNGIDQPSYDLSDFGVVLDSENGEELGHGFDASTSPTSNEQGANPEECIVTPTGDDAATLLAILGLDRNALWNDVRHTHRSLIADHLAAGESDPERAILARSIRREINTAYAALRLLHLN